MNRNLDISEFTANYAQLADDELLCLWAERNTLVPEATAALDREIEKRGLRKQNATRVKKRLDALAAREAKGPLENQIAAVNYERSMRHFVGSEEPEFYSRYRSTRDIRNMFAYIRHTYRVWRAFREHTGHWPVFSIWFHFLSWTAVFGLAVAGLAWTADRTRNAGWTMVAVIGCFLVLLGVREWGARQMRKLDWTRYGR